MVRPRGAGPGGGLRAEREEDRPRRERIVLEAVDFQSAHGLLKACEEDVGWRNAGERCAGPAWTPSLRHPVSHTLTDRVRIALRLDLPERARSPSIRGVGPGDLVLAPDGDRAARDGAEIVHSTGSLSTRIEKLAFDVRWSEGGGEALSPGRTESVVYATLGRPRDDRQADWPEDGVTLKRMDRAVSWVAALETLDPHTIVHGLMDKFPYYALHPSPKVPRRYHHPTYFNAEGGAWPMSDYVEESGECQAIVRLVRGVLRQLGVPGEARTVLVWGDPEVDGGRRAVSALWDDDPGAGLDRTKVVGGRVWLAALVDGPVEVGKVYPPSHTPRRSGPSPGFNRYEACLEFTYAGETRDYGGGAGVFRDRDEVLHGFWGLVWVSAARRHGFKVEEIVARY